MGSMAQGCRRLPIYVFVVLFFVCFSNRRGRYRLIRYYQDYIRLVGNRVWWAIKSGTVAANQRRRCVSVSLFLRVLETLLLLVSDLSLRTASAVACMRDGLVSPLLGGSGAETPTGVV